MNPLRARRSAAANLPALIAVSGEHAARRFVDFSPPTSATATRGKPLGGSDEVPGLVRGAPGARARRCATFARGCLITAYLKNGGTLEKAASMANHASTRTTQLYDHRADEVILDEVERVGV
jgi:hypothetical protein